MNHMFRRAFSHPNIAPSVPYDDSCRERYAGEQAMRLPDSCYASLYSTPCVVTTSPTAQVSCVNDIHTGCLMMPHFVPRRAAPPQGVFRSSIPRNIHSQFSTHMHIFAMAFTPIEDDLAVAVGDAVVIFDGNSLGHRIRPKITFDNLEAYRILDLDVSPDESWIVYASWSDSVKMLNLRNPTTPPISVGPTFDRGTFSAKFSRDGRYVLSGNNHNSVVLADVTTQQAIMDHSAHDNDVNAVCFVDPYSENIFVSGSDDAMVKLWDRRTTQKCIGDLPGHLFGVCYLDSLHDGRHILSTSKDQSIKLWDIRCISRVSTAELMADIRSRAPHWDYHMDRVPPAFRAFVHPHDKSLMTYQGGHLLSRTLIRAKFGPNGRSILTGSSNGQFVEYDALTGRIMYRRTEHAGVIRDFAYSSQRAFLCTGGFDGMLRVKSIGGASRERRAFDDNGAHDDNDDEDSEVENDDNDDDGDGDGDGDGD
eukprot:PhF_6_TR14149/c1_g1_i1/m.22636/K11801/WDR23; WD repeat-containing protein 23